MRVRKFTLCFFSDKILKRCLNELDNLNHPGLVIGHLVEAATENLFAGNFPKYLVTKQRTDEHP